MPPAGTIRVGAAKWLQDLNISNGTTPTASTHGVEIPHARKNEYSIFQARKSNAASFDIYGYDGEAWSIVETFALTRSANESSPMVSLGGFTRVASVRTDTNVQAGGHTNTFFGFIE